MHLDIWFVLKWNEKASFAFIDLIIFIFATFILWIRIPYGPMKSVSRASICASQARNYNPRIGNHDLSAEVITFPILAALSSRIRTG